ncbi:hypothetical protein [Fibrisoma montanum]|nr:hypothetical protein [Fibrisoma montanum]
MEPSEPKKTQEHEPTNRLVQVAVQLMLLFPDLPYDEALAQAQSWLNFFV